MPRLSNEDDLDSLREVYGDPGGELVDDECERCGGDGVVFECFDGFCADADIGCDDCTGPCPECSPVERAVATRIGEEKGR